MEKTKEKILLVETDYKLAETYAGMLLSNGYEVVIAATGQEALDRVREIPDISLVLMNIDLGPASNGSETAERLLSSRELPLVFLTSHAEREMVEKVRDITRYGYVTNASGDFVLLSTIELALKLFKARRENEKTLSALRESEEKYRTAFQTSPDSVNINTLDGKYVDINAGFTGLTGFTREDVIGFKSSDLGIWVIPEDRERLIRELKENGLVHNMESQFRCKDGTIKTALMSARILSLGGKPHILSITRDITERKRIERITEDLLEEKELLLREVHHRVKNTMASIASLLSLQAGSEKSPEASSALREMGSRIRSIQIVYEKLFHSQDYKNISFGEYLGDMMEVIRSSLPVNSTVKLESRLQDVQLEATRIFPLGLIANELVTNSLKHAFPNGHPGKILVVLNQLESGGCELVVSDDGMGLPETLDINNSTGFGLTLVAALTNQIGGSLTFKREGGTEIRVLFQPR